MQGTVTASYACDTFKYEFEVTGTNGSLLLQRSTSQPGYNLIVTKGTGKNATTVMDEFYKFGGIEKEFVAFAEACRSRDRSLDDKNTPEQALRDLELVEALLKSGKQSGALVKVR